MKTIPYNSRNILYKSKFGAVAEEEKVDLRILLHNDAKCERAFLRIRKDGFGYEHIELTPDEFFNNDFRFYKTTLSLLEGLYFYSFCFDSPWGRQNITRFKGSEGLISNDGGEWQLTVYEKSFETPQGFAGGLIYQIFPDRFYFSGEQKENVPEDRFINNNWFDTPEFRQTPDKKSLGNDYFCGDLRGITEKLSYLQELGVSIIYLNPIFEAHSNHRYNTADYLKIDPLLGTEEDLKELCKKAEKLGISVILDGVFSHTGDDSIYFNRYKRYNSLGAYNSTDSKYYSWFKFQKWPEKYHSWWGVSTLPETVEEDKGFLDYITGENGVLEHWLDCGVKGFRLDVADELPDVFLDKLRECVKRKNKDAIIIGEVWEDATNKIAYSYRRRYLRGKQLDSVMNYPFANAILDFVKGGNGDDLLEVLLDIIENYPRKCLNLLMNHIGTHDTARALTTLGGEPTFGRNRYWQAQQSLNEEEYELARKRLHLAVVLQYTLPGIPSLYYGDEAGLQGYGDPFCRACYPWGKEDQILLNFYKNMGNFRRSSNAFVDGEFIPIVARLGLFGFIRKSDSEEVFVCVNRFSDTDYVEISGFENAEIVYGRLPENGKIKIDGYGFVILRKKI